MSIEKSEKAKAENEEEGKTKRKPGGQPGHIGKTRKGFGRVDRYEISEPSACEQCGSKDLSAIIGDRKQQVATLAARPIEVVEYQRAKCQCLECGAEVIGAQAQGIVSGQDLSIDLQALLVWLGNYGRLSYEKQQELMWELGEIEVGVGTIQATNRRAAEAVESAVDTLWAWAPLQANVHVATGFLALIDEAFAQHQQWRQTQNLLAYSTWASDFKTRLAELLNTWLGRVGYAAGLLLRSLRDKAAQW